MTCAHILAFMDKGISLKATAERLGYKPATFRALLQQGWGQRWGLVELPRPPLGMRRFSEASVERVVTQGTGIVIKTRNRRAS